MKENKEMNNKNKKQLASYMNTIYSKTIKYHFDAEQLKPKQRWSPSNTFLFLIDCTAHSGFCLRIHAHLN